MLGHFVSRHFSSAHFVAQRVEIIARTGEVTFGHFSSHHFAAAHFLALKKQEDAEDDIHLLASDNNYEYERWESYFKELEARERKARKEVVEAKKKLRQKKKIQLQALDTQAQTEIELHILILQRSIQQANADINQIKDQMAQIEKERAEWLQVIDIVIEMMF